MHQPLWSLKQWIPRRIRAPQLLARCYKIFLVKRRCSDAPYYLECSCAQKNTKKLINVTSQTGRKSLILHPSEFHHNYINRKLQSNPKKIAQSLMHHHFTTVCHRITRFEPKCSAKITVCQSMQNLNQWFKYSLIPAGTGYMSSASSSARKRSTSDRWR